MWKIKKLMVINTLLETAIQCLGNSAYLQNLELRSSSWGVDKLNGGGGECPFPRSSDSLFPIQVTIKDKIEIKHTYFRMFLAVFLSSTTDSYSSMLHVVCVDN
jgi:hypothetical protein